MKEYLIDVHHHIIPEQYRSALAKYGVSFSGGKQIAPWTPDMSLAHMAALGVDTAVVSISEPALYPIVAADPLYARKLARELNEFMAEMKRRYPGKFGAFAVLPMPDVEGSIEEARYALDTLKLDGIGLLSKYGSQYLGDRVFEAFFEQLKGDSIPVYVHPSIPPMSEGRRGPEFLPYDYLQEFCFNTARACFNLILSGTTRRFPNLSFIFSHMGGAAPYLGWRVNSCVASSTAGKKPLLMEDYVWDSWKSLNESGSMECQDILTELGRLYYDTALSTHEGVLNLVKAMAPGHTLFGSDSFYASQEKGQQFVRNLNMLLDSEEKTAVFSGNAERLFPELYAAGKVKTGDR